MALGNNDTVEIDLVVNGKQATTALKDVEKAQDDLSKNSTKTTENIKTNWKNVGIAVAAASATMVVLAKRAAELEGAMFGLNESQKEWIEQASNRYAVDQTMIAGFVQMGKASGLAGDEIEQMTEQAFAMSKQLNNINFEGAVEDLTEFYSAGTLTGTALEYLEKTTGDAEIASRDLSYQMDALKASTSGVYDEWARTDAAVMARQMQELDNLSIKLGQAFFRLTGETGLLQKGVWVAEKAFLGLELAMNGWMQIYYMGKELIGQGSEETAQKLDALAKKAIEIRELLGGQGDEPIDLTLNARAPLTRPAGDDFDDSAFKKNNDAFKTSIEEDIKVVDEFENAYTNAIDGMSSALEEFVTTGKIDFGELAGSILNDIAKISAQAAVSSIFSNIGSSGGIGIESLLGSVFAKGGAFSNGNVTAFANGGVVGGPTIFPMANGTGLMGEAGPEAIVPLTRTSTGNLGVEATAPVVNVNVENYGNDNVQVQQNGDNISVIISQIAQQIQRGTGDVGPAIESRYGIRKQ